MVVNALLCGLKEVLVVACVFFLWYPFHQTGEKKKVYDTWNANR